MNELIGGEDHLYGTGFYGANMVQKSVFCGSHLLSDMKLKREMRRRIRRERETGKREMETLGS